MGSGERAGAASGETKPASRPAVGIDCDWMGDAFLPSLHGRNPKNAGSAASRGLRRVMDGSGHRDARDACPVSSMHAFQLGERVGCASGVAHAARSPRSRGPDPRQKPRRERREKTRVERRGEAGARGLVRVARRRGCVGPIRRLDDRTPSRRFHASRANPRGCPPLSRAPIVPGHGRFTPSVVRRSGLARRRRRASRVGQRTVRCGYVPRLDIFLECYTEAATRRVPKRAFGSSVSRFSTECECAVQTHFSGFRNYSGQIRIIACRGT